MILPTLLLALQFISILDDLISGFQSGMCTPSIDLPVNLFNLFFPHWFLFVDISIGIDFYITRYLNKYWDTNIGYMPYAIDLLVNLFNLFFPHQSVFVDINMGMTFDITQYLNYYCNTDIWYVRLTKRLSGELIKMIIGTLLDSFCRYQHWHHFLICGRSWFIIRLLISKVFADAWCEHCLLSLSRYRSMNCLNGCRAFLTDGSQRWQRICQESICPGFLLLLNDVLSPIIFHQRLLLFGRSENVLRCWGLSCAHQRFPYSNMTEALTSTFLIVVWSYRARRDSMNSNNGIHCCWYSPLWCKKQQMASQFVSKTSGKQHFGELKLD